MNEELMRFIVDLFRIYSLHGSFDASAAPDIGSEIYRHWGHAGMVDVCNAVRDELGGGAARDLEFRWHGIGEWLG